MAGCISYRITIFSHVEVSLVTRMQAACHARRFTMHWCRRRGCRSESATQKFWWKFEQSVLESGKNPWKSGKNPWKSGKNLWKPSQNLHKIPENLSKFPENISKNGAQNDMKSFFKGHVVSFFPGKFGRIQEKILHIPKNFPAPTLMALSYVK